MRNDYQMFCVSVRGASHVQAGTPKEDDAGLLKTDLGTIGVVSDGHGDRRCMRSHVGSHLAVEIAIAHLRQWLEMQRPAPKAEEAPAEAQPGTPAPEEKAAPEQAEAADGGAQAGAAPEAEKAPAEAPADQAAAEGERAADTAAEPAGEDAPAIPVEIEGGEPDAPVDVTPTPCAADPWSTECISRLCHGINDAWQEAVIAHYRANPLTEQEIQDAGNLYDTYAAGKRLPHIYGATLLAAVMTDEQMLLIQKGDGHAFFIYDDGTTSHDVIPWDERCQLNFTTSLCDTDAADTYKCAIVSMRSRPGIAAVVLASDGLEDCYATMDAADVAVGQIAVFGAQEGTENLQNYLQSELTGMSDRASRDDISVVGWLKPAAVLPFRRRFELLSEQFRVQASLKEAQLHLGSMSGSKQRMEDRMKKLQADLAQLRTDSEKLAEDERKTAERLNSEQAEMRDNPDMQRLHGALAVFGRPLEWMAAHVKSYFGLQRAIEEDQRILQQRAAQRKEIEARLQALQAEIDELQQKYGTYAERYEGWASQERRARDQLARISGDLAAPVQQEEPEEDAEEAFRRMMED